MTAAVASDGSASMAGGPGAVAREYMAAEQRAGAAYAIGAAAAIVRGHWYRLKYRVLRARFHAGRNLRVYGRLEVRGPGEVRIGDDALVLDRARLRSHDAGAVIRIGDRVQMGAVLIDCAREVAVGNDCQLAESYIADTDSHSTNVNRHDPLAPVHVAPVSIADNVWLAQYACVLPGARIGRDSVVSCGSVCNRAYGDGVVLVGNPARPVGRVPEPATLPSNGDRQ